MQKCDKIHFCVNWVLNIYNYNFDIIIIIKSCRSLVEHRASEIVGQAVQRFVEERISLIVRSRMYRWLVHNIQVRIAEYKLTYKL